MCTMIADKIHLAGSAKGPQGWFEVTQAYVGYDHPVHAPVEHALSLDFVNEAQGPGTRLAVELTRDSARELAEHLLQTLDAADRYERGG